MSEYRHITPMCDCHQDEPAQVFCRNHKKLLCLSCVLGEKSSECSIIEIRKVSEENDTLMLECLVTKQEAENKRKLIDDHKSKTEAVRTNLEEQVNEMHNKLTKRINEMKDRCLESIETKARAIIKGDEENKQQLIIVETEVNGYLDKLSESSLDDSDGIRPNLLKLNKEVVQNIPDKKSVPEGLFKPNDSFSDFIFQEDTFLGHVYLTDTENYDTIDDLPENIVEIQSQETIQSNSEASSLEEDSKPVLSHENFSALVYTSSDEMVYQIENDTLGLEQSGEVSGKSMQADKNSSEEKKSSGGIFGGLRKLFSLEIKRSVKSDREENDGDTDKTSSVCDSKSKSTEHVYDVSHCVLPKHMINRTAVLSSLKQQFSSACKFSRLVYLADGFIGLLSKVHNSFVMADLNGNVYNTKTMIGGLEDVAATGKNEVALLVENGHQICKFNSTIGGFSKMEHFVLQEDIQNISGFDFDVTSSQFAISSPNKLVTFDKSGRKLKSVQYNSVQVPSTQMTTAYDFRRECLYIMNIPNKSLKCFCFKTSSVLWRCRYEGGSFTPKSMCLYKDTICIASRDEIVLILADDGSLAAKHDTKRLLQDCLGLCIIDDVIVFTSDSDDFTESTKLAYVSI